MMRYIAIEQSTGRIDAVYEGDEPPVIDGHDVIDAPADFDRGWPPGPSNAAVLHFIDGALVWRESATLADVVAAAVDEIDGDAESARAAVLAKKATKAEEYTQAEEQARGWHAAEYAGKAPPDVASWAAAKWRDGMTDRQAAESVIAQADAYRTLLSGIRALRLLHMENARHATSPEEARAEVSAFRTALAGLMMF